MIATDRRGFTSVKALLLLGVLVVGAYYLADVRDWGQKQLEANASRSHEFDRRVKAQRHAALKPDLERVGIHVDEAPAPFDTSAGVEADVARPSIGQWLPNLWYRLRGAPPPVEPPPIPVLRDSLGLLPGERMYLPNGKVVEYDSTVFTYQRTAPKQ
jgi:hypothetical protein